MNVFSILNLTLMVAITIEASKEGDPLIDINESQEEGRIFFFVVDILICNKSSQEIFKMALNLCSF